MRTRTINLTMKDRTNKALGRNRGLATVRAPHQEFWPKVSARVQTSFLKAHPTKMQSKGEAAEGVEAI